MVIPAFRRQGNHLTSKSTIVRVGLALIARINLRLCYTSLRKERGGPSYRKLIIILKCTSEPLSII